MYIPGPELISAGEGMYTGTFPLREEDEAPGEEYSGQPT